MDNALLLTDTDEAQEVVEEGETTESAEPAKAVEPKVIQIPTK
jgi:hypothetical protein